MPNESQAYSRVTKENQHFFLNSVEIPGIQNFTADSPANVGMVKFFGMRNAGFLPNGEQVGNISLSASLITDDQFISLTGANGFNGFILKERDAFSDNFAFTSGFMTSYSSKYSFGQLPQIDVSAVIFGDIGKLTLAESTLTQPLQLKIPGPGCVDISINDFATSRVLGYDLNISIPRAAIFTLGNRYPTRVVRTWPMEVSCNFQVEVNTFEYNKLRDYPYNKRVENLTLSIRAYDTNSTIASYSFSNLELLSQNYTTNVDSNAVLNLKYNGLIMS